MVQLPACVHRPMPVCLHYLQLACAPGLTFPLPLLCRDALLGSVDPVPALKGTVSTGGRLNVAKALSLLLGEPTPTLKRKLLSLLVSGCRVVGCGRSGCCGAAMM